MSDSGVLHLEQRRAMGRQAFKQVMAAPLEPAATLMEESYQLFLFGEVWTRPALDRRSRYWISLSCLGVGNDLNLLEQYARGMLLSGDATLEELREFVLHFAVYCGWPAGLLVDKAVSRVALDLKIEDRTEPLQSTPLAREQRRAEGEACYQSVMTFPPPAPDCSFYLAIRNYVFGEMWDRPGLDRRSRRWITLACVGVSDTEVPIRTHVYAALNSGQCSPEEMQEFVLHFATYAGWPKASIMQLVTNEMIARVRDGLDYA